MLLEHFLNLCEKAAAKSVLSFKTKQYEGTLTIEAGTIVRIVGFDPAKIREVLAEELIEVAIKRIIPDHDTVTRLEIKSLSSGAPSTPAASARKSPIPSGLPGVIVSSKSSQAKPAGSVLIPANKAKDPKVEQKNLDSRKTMNVDASNQVPHIMLPFMIGRPEKKVIGRSERCDIVVESYDVSREHCEVTFCGKNLQVKDLSSSNGTFINGKQIVESTASSHDILRLGSVPFIVVIDGTS